MQQFAAHRLQSSACFFVLLLSSLIFFGCIAESEPRELSVQEIYESFVTEGLTCEVQASIISLPNGQHLMLRELIFENIVREEITMIVEDRERGCLPPEDNYQDANPANRLTQAVTDTYTVEFIEETTGSGGYYPTSVFRDSSSYGWMCNSGSWEWPADWIIQYYVPNSYSNLSDLRIRGTNTYASCYITDSTAARVYSDNDIRACFGYWRVWDCTWTTGPTAYESLIWIQ